MLFPFLRPDTEYGKLCVLEEPLVTGYTAMGRLVAGLHIHKCYFGAHRSLVSSYSFHESLTSYNSLLPIADGLKTKDYDLSTMDAEASAFKRAASATSAFAGSSLAGMLALAGLLLVAGQR